MYPLSLFPSFFSFANQVQVCVCEVGGVKITISEDKSMVRKSILDPHLQIRHRRQVDGRVFFSCLFFHVVLCFNFSVVDQVDDERR